MWVLLAGEDVEAIVKNEKARVQAARRDDGVKKAIISGFGDSHETHVASASHAGYLEARIFVDVNRIFSLVRA